MKLILENWRKFIKEDIGYFGNSFVEFKNRVDAGEHLFDGWFGGMRRNASADGDKQCGNYGAKTRAHGDLLRSR